MPWKPSDAPKKTKKADTPKEKELWANVANEVLRKSKGDDAKAVLVANAAIQKKDKK